MGSSTYVCCIKNRNKKKRIKEKKKGENKKYKNLNGFCYVGDICEREKNLFFYGCTDDDLELEFTGVS